MDEQEEEGLHLTASVEAMRQGEGLDDDALIQTPAFKDIHQYLLQSGSKQTVEKVKAKLLDLDLSFLDEEEEDTIGVDATRKGIDEVVLGEQNLVSCVVEKGAPDGGTVEKEVGVYVEVEGGRSVDPIFLDLVI